MKLVSKYVSGALAAVLATVVFTKVAHAGYGWSTGIVTSVIAGYGPPNAGNVYVTGLPLGTGSPCTSSQIEFLPANGDPQKVLALATAAFLSGKHLSCYISPGCGTGGYQVGSTCSLQP